ncbi:MAG TPA: hypothetical protein VMQ10_13675 [Spirochaetia bacterium]|nr:hypothetical protein [Spirochaetia bacterium]
MAEKIGEFLVKIGAITQAQVDHVLELQAKGDSRIFGEIALELSYINDEAIRRYVDALEKFKKS